MKVTFGLKAHSGWAALVVLGKRGSNTVVVDRRRIELVEVEWAKQPYHAAEDLKPAAARALVKRGIEAAHRIAIRELRAAVKRERGRDNEVTACAILAGNLMPEWSVEQILSVHFRMHQAEGVLFREALVGAAKECALKVIEIPEKMLMNYAAEALETPLSELPKKISVLGKSAGPPWGKDQKNAALAAMVAFHRRKK